MNRSLQTFLIVIVAIFLTTILAVVVDRNRTTEEPGIRLFSPTVQLPRPSAVVYVRYPWGATHARYLQGDANRPDMWIEHNELHQDEAAYDLTELWGLPVWWGYDPAIPKGLEGKK